MINIIHLSRARQNRAQFEYLNDLEKQALQTPLKSISPKENEKIIKIDKFIFTPFSNIESLDYELSLGISKVETLSQNYYLRLGGNEGFSRLLNSFMVKYSVMFMQAIGQHLNTTA
ncbi:hypothetical protein [Helicobacter typhlonius]|uniref:hypothetical protein n=1 Tax=Helicobacter typhlonius TaxID=76936 RepID=UPI002FE075E2